MNTWSNKSIQGQKSRWCHVLSWWWAKPEWYGNRTAWSSPPNLSTSHYII